MTMTSTTDTTDISPPSSSNATHRITTASNYAHFHPRALATHPSKNYLALSGPLGISVSKLSSSSVPAAAAAAAKEEDASVDGFTSTLESVLTLRHIDNSSSGSGSSSSACSLKFAPAQPNNNEMKLASAIGSSVVLWDVASGHRTAPIVRLTIPRQFDFGRQEDGSLRGVAVMDDINNNVRPLDLSVSEGGGGGNHHSRYPSLASSIVTDSSFSGGLFQSSCHSTTGMPSQTITKSPNTFYQTSFDHTINGQTSSQHHKYSSKLITSLVWADTGNELFVSAGNMILMWDTREVGYSSRPAVCFTSKGEADNAVHNFFSHIDINKKRQIGSIDHSGLVRIFDLREASISTNNNLQSRKRNKGCLAAFSAHEEIGVGITAFDIEYEEDSYQPPSWVTWGCDSQGHGNAKIWLEHGVEHERSRSSSFDPNLYWFEGDMSDFYDDDAETLESKSSFRLFDTIRASASVACVRNGPKPFDSMFVTIGMTSPGLESPPYHVNLWDISNGVESACSLELDIESQLSKMAGNAVHDVGQIIAAELCKSDATTHQELQLCCLTSSGYLTTLGLPASSTLIETKSGISPTLLPSSPPRWFPHKDFISPNKNMAREKISGDNHFWQTGQLPMTPRDESLTNILDVARNETQFDIDTPFENSDSPYNNKPTSFNDRDDRKPNFVDISQAHRVPCPRLCGASFGFGSGKLICFKNGKIKAMWSWLERHEAQKYMTSRRATKTLTSNDRRTDRPRTLSDLFKLVNTSKKAQWGEDDDNESSSVEGYDDSSESSDDLLDESEYFQEKIETPTGYEVLSSSRRGSVLDRIGTSAAVLSTETLSPIVECLFFDDIVLRGQCCELAKKWMLAEWAFSLPNDSVSKVKKRGESSSLYRRPIFSHRSNNEDSFQKVKSGLRDDLASTTRSLPDSKKMLSDFDNESMPRPSSVGSNLSSSIFFEDASIEEEKTRSESFEVRTLSRPSDLSDSDLKQVANMERICLHNAHVCYGIGQRSKGDVWIVLSQSVRHAFSQDTDEFNGWRRSGGGSLGREFVTKVLNHYEKEGDIQMCATIVCCLKQHRNNSSTSSYFLENSILPCEDLKHDGYIQRYAELLFFWNQTITRAEVLKHLSSSNAAYSNEDKSLSQISITPICQICKESENKDNLCTKCEKVAFRCSVCDCAVRGHFTFCMICGHGGHSEHILSWFSESNECPTGCGCVCKLDTLATMQPNIVKNTRNIPKTLFGGNDLIQLRRNLDN